MRFLWTLLLLFIAPAAAAQPPGPTATWYTIVAENGDRLGYASRETIAGREGREIVDASEIRLQEGADPTRRIVERTVTRLGGDGRPVAINASMQMGPAWSRIEARIGADVAEIVRHASGERRTMRLALPAGVRFDAGEGLLEGWDPATTPRLEFQNFNIGAQVVERITIEAAPGAAADAEGRITVLRKRYEGAELRGVARLLLDRERRLLEIAQPMFGTSIATRVADRETALAPHRPYSLLHGAMMRSPFRMSDDAVRGHIRYRFAFRDGIEFALPQTGEQRVTARPGETIVDICLSCGPGLATDPATLADALRPTLWLQSDHPRLRAIVGLIRTLPVNGARKMELLLERARPYLFDVDFSGHFSALETVLRRSGDCTEAAVLLAALGRAAGIPTRVASGIVYSRQRYHGVSNVFMPHSWVLAYVDGRWKSFDLALESFDSTHVALTVGDGDTRSIMAASQLASLLRWEDVAEIRARPR
ncbi:MAG TPA: transglutaminase-like domain-containing protein [Allosphingosinicella sp.]|nr:transglutaminase-like domain-containing protein [Allosphingosinicella sp.]